MRVSEDAAKAAREKLDGCMRVDATDYIGLPRDCEPHVRDGRLRFEVLAHHQVSVFRKKRHDSRQNVRIAASLTLTFRHSGSFAVASDSTGETYEIDREGRLEEGAALDRVRARLPGTVRADDLVACVVSMHADAENFRGFERLFAVGIWPRAVDWRDRLAVMARSLVESEAKEAECKVS